MASSGGDEFELWLRELLDSYGADGEVFGEYISGTLNTMEDSPEDEIHESLFEILQGSVESDSNCEELSKQITQRWMKEMHQRKEQTMRVEAENVTLVTTTKQEAAGSSLTTTTGTERSSAGMSAEEKKKLIAQYDCESDEEEEYGEEREARTEPRSLFQNTNSATVAEGLRQKKEQQKAAHDAKLERDKRSREMQKQKVQDRKEKEKKRTQKHERRR